MLSSTMQATHAMFQGERMFDFLKLLTDGRSVLESLPLPEVFESDEDLYDHLLETLIRGLFPSAFEKNYSFELTWNSETTHETLWKTVLIPQVLEMAMVQWQEKGPFPLAECNWRLLGTTLLCWLYSTDLSSEVLEDPPSPPETEQCSICHDPLFEGFKVRMPCGHPFHQGCIDEWTGPHLQTTCPLCRQSLYG